MKALQIHSEESLQRSAEMSVDEILRFLEEFRVLYGGREQTQGEECGTLTSSEPDLTQQTK